MDKQTATQVISDLIQGARNMIDRAADLGREHDIPVDLGALGVGEDMWYVTEQEYRRDYIAENYFEMDRKTFDYIPRELTSEELQEVEEHMKSVREEDGYSDGYKVTGWLSSSTNC